MTKLGLVVVLVEICGIWFYYNSQNYLGIIWCLFWALGIIYYEKRNQSNFRNRDDVKHLLAKYSVITNKRAETGRNDADKKEIQP